MIMREQELQVQKKQEVEKKQETTYPTRLFQPVADIFETDNNLTVVLEMPGVGKDSVDVGLDNGVLTVSGQIDFSKYDGLQPVYTEYNIGNYQRSFRLSNAVDQDRISAELKDGVMTLSLPKAETAKTRRIPVN